MGIPKKIDIIIQPLISAEGVRHEYISVDELKQHIEEIKELDGKVMTVDVDKLLEFINK